MKIYTKTGDQGNTGLVGGQRVLKNHLRIESYGTLDEANCLLGVAIEELSHETETSLKDLKEFLKRTQHTLFQVGAELATPDAKKVSEASNVSHIHITALESQIDLYTKELPGLKNFILPGGSRVAATLHLARAVVRRAEREIVGLMQILNEDEQIRSEILIYINRLSDFLFTAARWTNWKKQVADELWTSSG